MHYGKYIIFKGTEILLKTLKNVFLFHLESSLRSEIHCVPQKAGPKNEFTITFETLKIISKNFACVFFFFFQINYKYSVKKSCKSEPNLQFAITLKYGGIRDARRRF